MVQKLYDFCSLRSEFSSFLCLSFVFLLHLISFFFSSLPFDSAAILYVLDIVVLSLIWSRYPTHFILILRRYWIEYKYQNHGLSW